MSANTNSLSLVKASSQYATASDSVSLGITSNITIEHWIKLTSTNAYSPIIYKGYDESGSNRSINYMIDTGSSGQMIRFLYTNSNAFKLYQTSSTTLSLNVWHHIAVTNIFGSTGSCIIYVDGVAVSGSWILGNGSDTVLTNTSDLRISTYYSGNPLTTGGFIDGLIDDVRIWNLIRTSTEIANNYNVQLVGNETGLVGYWQLNNDYLDTTANGNTLTPVNSPVFSTDVPFIGITTPTDNAIFFGANF